MGKTIVRAYLNIKLSKVKFQVNMDKSAVSPSLSLFCARIVYICTSRPIKKVIDTKF